MADGTEKPIEQIRIGDLVLAFDAHAALGRGALVPRPVTRTFQNITQTIIDLRGTRMTPGHVCLTDHGRFETIAAILARDGALVDRHGTPLRARTGARLDSPEDTQVAIVYADPATGEGIMQLLDSINRSGTTVVMATHDHRIVNMMRKRVIQLDRGVLVRDQERGVYE
jgi:hypothetical protein